MLHVSTERHRFISILKAIMKWNRLAYDRLRYNIFKHQAK